MKINFDAEILEIDGKPAMYDDKPLTLARACAAALLNDTTGEGIAKDRRFRMALKLIDGGTVDMPTADVAWLKDIVGRIILSTVHVGRIWQLLEQETAEAAPGNVTPIRSEA